MTSMAMAGTSWYLRINLDMIGTSNTLCYGVAIGLQPWWVRYVFSILLKLDRTAVVATLISIIRPFFFYFSLLILNNTLLCICHG